jgi:tetrapyrrole methylase family protein/MazG family protein
VENSRVASDFFAADVMSQIESHTALQFAVFAQRCSAEAGFDFESIYLAMDKVHEELKELEEAFDSRDKDFQHFAEELGDCFFALVNICRHAGLSPEELLKSNTNKYLARCTHVENQLRTQGQSWKSTPLQDIYAMWRSAKLESTRSPISQTGITGEAG